MMDPEKISRIADVAMALGKRYFTVCTVLLHPYQPKNIPIGVFTLFKLLALGSEHQIAVVSRNFLTYPAYLKEVDLIKCSRTMNIIYGEEGLVKDLLAKLTKEVPMAGPVWFVSLEETTVISEFLKNYNLPFDVDFVIAQIFSNNSAFLHEAYRASLKHPVRVLPFGKWSAGNGLTSPPHISLYYRRNDFEGVEFKVATTESFPIVSVTTTKDHKMNITGYFANVWKDLESRLNFSSVYDTPDENVTGVLRNGHWTGVTGMVVNKTSDVGVSCLSISQERSKVVDYLRPLISTRNNLFFKKPGLEIRWKAIFRPFESYVWVTILVWIIVGAIFLHNTLRVENSYNLEPGASIKQFSVWNSFFYLLQSFSQQGMENVPGTWPGRIIIITTYLASVIIFTAYSGALISFIAVQVPRVPFHTLNQLEKDESYKLQVVRNTASYMYFANATDLTLNKLYARMESELPDTFESGLSRLCTQYKLVHFGPQAAMDLIVQKLNLQGCNIIALPNALNTVYLSVIIQKKNQYKDALNHHLDMMIYQGLLGRLRKQLWPTLGALLTRREIEVPAEQVVPIYIILLGGLFISVIIFLAEKWKVSFAKKKMRKMVMKNHDFYNYYS